MNLQGRMAVQSVPNIYEDSHSQPIVTYKHLHTANISYNHPLRVIALVDSDAFYAACEMIRLGVDRETPLVVLQWSSFIAVNYPARKYGISRFGKEPLSVEEAKKRCPELRVVHVATYKEGEPEPGYFDKPDPRTHKVSLDYYRRESKRVHQVIADGVLDGVSERASIDEAFIDFTRPVLNLILDQWPELRQPPEGDYDAALPSPPANLSWEGLGWLIPVHTPTDPPEDTDDAPLEPPITWHDVALSIAARLMLQIRTDIDTRLGYTTSAGLARNKFLAKLCASYKKPNSQSILRDAAIPSYLRPLPFQKIRFLGGKLGKAIADEFDASTVGDLLEITLEEMQSKFGENAVWIYELLRGIDRSEVKPKPEQTKSMLASKNLPKPITKPPDGFHWIRVLAAELALRLREACQEDPGLWPKTIVLHVRKGYENGRSRQAAFPHTKDVTVDLIAAAGNKLWNELIGTNANTELKVTSLQLAFTGIEAQEAGQKNIEEFFGFGTKRKRSERATSPAKTLEDRDIGFSFYKCSKCNKRIRIPCGGDEERAEAEVIKVEHEDFHLAMELAKEADNAAPAPSIPKRVKKDEPKRTPAFKGKEGGIERFFTRGPST